MKRQGMLLAGMVLSVLSVFGTSTTYMFRSAEWQSSVGPVVCDGKSDGWVCVKAGASYDAGRTWADGSLHGAGIKVEKAQSGAGATSVIAFEKVRKVIVDFCLSSKGKGDITIAIGDTVMSVPVSKSMKTNESADLNEEVTFTLQSEKSGKITLSVENVTNSSVYIRSITIKADNGSGEVFSHNVYHLVTDVNQLQDSDLIMIGIADGKTNKALGYFDTDISKNNIHAVNATYDSEREYIRANEEVTYVLRKAVSEKGKAACYTIIDPYAEAYLVASGGKTKNALRLWDKPYDPTTYGDYGYWDIQIASDGTATIMCLGNSLGKYIQYNPTFELFGCYQQETMGAVSIYRQEEEKDPNQPMIVAPIVNCGTAVMRGVKEIEGSKTIEVKANKLSEDISVSLKGGTVFALSSATVDRDGEQLTIIYKVSEAGKYSDTLVLSSGDVKTEVPVHLTVARELSIAEAVQSKDFEYIYLNPVTVTKKYDRQVYVRDASGAMMLYDEGPDAQRYAKDLQKGHVLRGVEGKYQNYWGVPELHLMAAPTHDAKPAECLPDTMVAAVDSADVCRYVLYDSVAIVYGELEAADGIVPWPAIEAEDGNVLLSEWFTLGDQSESFYVIEERIKNGGSYLYRVEGIVSYDYDEVVLYPTMITLLDNEPEPEPEPEPDPEGIEDTQVKEGAGYRIELRKGMMVITNGEKSYDLVGREQ